MNKEEYIFFFLADIFLNSIDYISDYHCFIDVEIKPKIRNLIIKYNIILEDRTINYPNMENLGPVFLFGEEHPELLRSDDYFFIIYLKGKYYQYIVEYYTFKYPYFDFANPNDNSLERLAKEANLNSEENSRKGDDFVETMVYYKDFAKAQIEDAKVLEQQMYSYFLENSPHLPRFTQRKFLNVSLRDLLGSQTSFADVIKNFARGLYNFFKGYMSQTVEVPLEVSPHKDVNFIQDNYNLVKG